MSEELKSCPFCGCKAYSRYVEADNPFGEVECGGCGVEMEALTEAKAIAAWNTRTPPAPGASL